MDNLERDRLRERFSRNNAEFASVFEEIFRLEGIVDDVEQLTLTHVERLATETGATFDDFLRDLQAKYRFSDADLTEEVAAARAIWQELAQEADSIPVIANAPITRRLSLKFGCKACKLTVTATFIAAGGVLGVVAYYSAGTAVPAYFAGLAAALGIGVSALYAILGAVVAGTIAVSDVPHEICRARRKC
jgi:hypothetical protein